MGARFDGRSSLKDSSNRNPRQAAALSHRKMMALAAGPICARIPILPVRPPGAVRLAAEPTPAAEENIVAAALARYTTRC
jgi:hypothetical protein